jgi:hypothetical protein
LFLFFFFFLIILITLFVFWKRKNNCNLKTKWVCNATSAQNPTQRLPRHNPSDMSSTNPAQGLFSKLSNFARG